jgi:hypothetical protein
MKINKTTLLLIATLFLLAMPMIFSGNASAKYMGDGATQNGTTGGWNTPNDMACIVGVHTNGTLDIADGVTNARDCIYLQTGTMNGGTPFDLTGMTTSAACTTAGGAGNDGAKHSWATSFCTKSLKGLDRTQKMCEGIGGTWITTGKCVAYGRQFKGQDTNGTPLAFGTKGTDPTVTPGVGFCYATIDLTTAIPAASCPSVAGSSYGTKTATSSAAFGYSATATKCTYSYGIKGYPSSALTKADGTTVSTSTNIDLSTYTTMGDCLANGGTWNNWNPNPTGTSSVATTVASTIATFDLTKQAVNADDGCLHCHSSLTEYNGPAEREKDSYLKTGHKNMLRKVVVGKSWAGPDGEIYTQDTAGHAIDFGAGTVGGGPLYYIFGDWMAALPDAVGPSGDTTTYSCASCHTAGYKDNTNPGVQSIGTPGYTPAEPAASGSGYVSVVTAGNKWDNEGITCGRCHNAMVPSVTAAQIAASTFTTTAPTSGGMGALASGTGRTNLCFGCHGGGSMAKLWPAQGGAAGGTAQYDPTLVATGVSHGAAAGRDFNGHILGNAFLNSPHARYAGVNSNSANGGTKLNSLGKNDLYDPSGTSEYGSIFKGYTCWQSPTTNSPAKTKADGTEIKTKSECESLYGAGSWRADQDGSLAATSMQGTCTTCHDVHNSLFVDSQAEAAIRKTCEDCHVNNSTTGATDGSAPQVVVEAMNHPMGGGTPFDTTKYESACVVCHMATQAVANGNANSLAAHVWRINTDASYNTFPTTAQFYGGSCSVHTGAVQNSPYLPVVYLSDISSANCATALGTWTNVTKDRNAQTAPDGAYTNAVWVDLDMACGQCHGGSAGQEATKNNAPFMDKAYLAAVAASMHGVSASAAPTANATVTVSNYTVTLTDNSSNGSNITVNWNDGSVSTGASGDVKSHTYTNAGTYTIKDTAAANGMYDTKFFTVAVPNTSNQQITGTVSGYAGFDASNTNIYLKQNGITKQIASTTSDGLFTFNTAPGSYTVQAYKYGVTFTEGNVQAATVTAGNNTTLTFTAGQTKFSLSVDTTPAVAGAVVIVKLNGVTKAIQQTDGAGTVSWTNLFTAGTYSVSIYKNGAIDSSQDVTVGPNGTVHF